MLSQTFEQIQQAANNLGRSMARGTITHQDIIGLAEDLRRCYEERGEAVPSTEKLREEARDLIGDAMRAYLQIPDWCIYRDWSNGLLYDQGQNTVDLYISPNGQGPSGIAHILGLRWVRAEKVAGGYHPRAHEPISMGVPGKYRWNIKDNAGRTIHSFDTRTAEIHGLQIKFDLNDSATKTWWSNSLEALRRPLAEREPVIHNDRSDPIKVKTVWS